MHVRQIERNIMFYATWDAAMTQNLVELKQDTEDEARTYENTAVK